MASRFTTASWWLVLIALTLSLVGTLFVFEASVAESYALVGNQYHFFIQHLRWLAVGWVTLITTMVLPTAWWKKLAPLIYVATIFLLIMVLIPGIGLELNGARRWIQISSFTLQPVEPLKLSLILFFASWLSKHQRTVPFLFLTVIPVGLLLLQPDLGSSLIILVTAFGLFFAAGAKLSHFLLLTCLGILAVMLLILVQPYRLERLTTFLNPELDPLGSSFHIRQITLALGNGSWFGQGIGGSKQRFSYIPEASSDSIFAIIAEEVGFIGASTIIIFFGLYLFTAQKIVQQQQPGSFSYLLGIGITIWISAQTILNLAAVVALVPLTGLPLPFVSYGGTALVMTLSATGILSRMGTTRKRSS